MPICDVSVVIPTYNRPELLKRALMSVARQTCAPRETIVVDDNSEAPVEPFVAGLDLGIPVKAIRHDENRGPAAARNTGLRAAKGTYVAFLDCDDEWLPQKLEHQIGFLTTAERSSNHPVASATGFEIDHGLGTFVRRPNDHRSTEDIIWGCGLSPGSTLMCNRALFHEFGPFNEALRRFEDWDWLLRFIEPGTVAVLPDVLARVHVLSRPAEAVVRQSGARLYDLALASHLSRHPAMMRRLRSSLFIEYAAASHHAGRSVEAALWAIRALLLWPFRNLGFFWRLTGHVARGRPSHSPRPEAAAERLAGNG